MILKDFIGLSKEYKKELVMCVSLNTQNPLVYPLLVFK